MDKQRNNVLFRIIRLVGQGAADLFRLFQAAGKQFVATNAPEAAAGIAYYALFSLFPLLLVFIAFGSHILEEEVIRQQLSAVIPEIFPFAQQDITRIIQTLLESRGTVTAIGMVGLVWSATSVFYLLSLNITRAWISANQRSFIRRRLLALAIVGLFLVLLLSLMFLNQLFDLIVRYNLEGIDPSFFASNFWREFSHLIVFMLKFAVLFLLYWWIPNTRVHKRAALWGSAFTAGTLELTRILFFQLVRLGWIRYELIYGSIGAVITFLVWVYLMSWLILFGAHLSAVIDSRLDRQGEMD